MVMPMNSFGMGTSGNVYDNLKAKYSCGYVDRAERPKVSGYPVAIVPEAQPKMPETKLSEWIRKLFR